MVEARQRDGFCWCGCGGKTNVAKKSDKYKGNVKGQPIRFIAGHQRRSAPVQYEVMDTGYKTPCWVWQWSTDLNGYGQLRPKETRRIRQAHILFYERLHGPVPPGMQLDHLCRVPACVNPDHLEVVTNAENTRRGRQAKLNYGLVEEIRASDESARSIALRLGVDPTTVASARSGKTWGKP